MNLVAMRLYMHFILLAAILHSSYAPPVSPEKTKEPDSDVIDDVAEFTEYHRYLKEVVQALESDPDFRERLEKADEEDVRSGKIAEQLDFVNHNVRTRLDEIKRQELERLRHLATKQYELTNNLNVDGKVHSNEHLDHLNPHTFEIEDLKKLIHKTMADLEAADKKRREQFKEYEMQKEYEKHQKIEALDEVHKKEYMEKLKEEEEAKKHHKPLNHPVTRQQLLALWRDINTDKDFDPRVFFVMHDVDGNGVWDADEVKALFIKELDKMYGPGGPNKDLNERAEEMERMREHVFKENDRNHDGLIDFNEFMTETQRAEFNQDDGWKPIDENQIYTQAEYEAYERRRQEELHYLQQRGLVDAHGRPIPGAQHQINQAYRELQQQFRQQQQHPHGQPNLQYPQGQHPPQYQGQAPQGQFHGQAPQGQYQGQVPQYQGQIPQGQYQGQAPQGQYQGQAPQGQYQGQAPQGQYQGQIPQGQYQSQGQQGQVPVGQNQQAQIPVGQNPQGQAPQAQVQQQIPQAQVQQQIPQGQVPPQASQGQAPPQQQQNINHNQAQA